MTNIFKYQSDLNEKALKKLEKCNSLGIDVETTGLKIPFFVEMLHEISPDKTNP